MQKQITPQRLKRSESFFGIHFDFHARDDCNEIGANTTVEMIETVIREVLPDYIQCDCKGHPGYSSYPTKVGYAAPGIVKDALKIWRKVTAHHGIALYMHYSGVWDTEALKHHPSWACIDEKGKRDKDKTSVFGPYVDKLLIPQLKELCDEYDVDGVWVDGDCWAVCRDYGKKVLETFKKVTGIENIPRKPDDANYIEFSEYCREGFRKYLRHYIDTLHKHNPNFQIASNWAFSSQMPEPVSAAVDFLSGDFTLQNSLNSARLEGRCLAKQGMPWDLAAWAFSCHFGEPAPSTKSIPQLQHEAASVISLGGGFQAYFTQKRDGSISLWQIKLMKKVGKFCRERQKICHNAESVPQVALYYSTSEYYRKNSFLFNTWKDPIRKMKGILQCLLENQYSVDILMDHHVSGKVDRYPLVVVPEWEFIEADVRKGLLSYVENGGNLLVIGPEAAANFENELGIGFDGDLEEKAILWMETDGWLAGSQTAYRCVRLKDGATGIGKLFRENDNNGAFEIPASVASYGRGKIAGIYLDMGINYINGMTSTARNFMRQIVGELFPKPMAEVKGSHYVDVAVNKKDGKLAVNLLNTAGPHADASVYVYDDIPALSPVSILIRTTENPESVYLEPGKIPLDYIYENCEIHLTIQRLEIHCVIVVEFPQ